MTENICETPNSTPNFRSKLASQLAELVPEAVSDGKIDIIKLQELLSDDITDSTERFGLFWPGKKRSLRAAQKPTTATLEPDKTNSKNWDTTKNVFVEGDNLEVLKILQKHYHNKIKMIYIDPPYNTGKDFVYPDNYKEGLKSYLQFTKQVDEGGKKLSTNSETEGRYHSNWLNMMYPRLKLARNLLTDDGVIFISIDDNEYGNLKQLVKEIFGDSNVIATFIWKNKKGGGNDSKYVAVEHEYCLMIARNTEQVPKLFIDHSEKYLERYKNKDEGGVFYWDTFRRKTGKQYYPIACPDGTTLEFDEHGNKLSWLRSESRFKSDLEKKEIRFIQNMNGWSVQFKQRKPEGKKPRSILADYGTTSVGNSEILKFFSYNIFDNPKPSSLIAHFVSIITSGNDLVLDFFAGSGTTAHAVMAQNHEDGGNRRFIQIQLPEPLPRPIDNFVTIADVARKRIDLAGEHVKQKRGSPTDNPNVFLDIGYRAYKLVDTNFLKWQATSNITEQELQQHLLNLQKNTENKTSTENLLTEILLKQGYSLTEQINSKKILGLEIQTVGNEKLFAYLNTETKPTLKQLQALTAAAPQKLVILEDVFAGDDELKTKLTQLCKTNNIELWTA